MKKEQHVSLKFLNKMDSNAKFKWTQRLAKKEYNHPLDLPIGTFKTVGELANYYTSLSELA